MAIPHYTFQNRHGMFYFRIVIPSSLQTYFPFLSKELRRSLKTRCRKTAISKARMMWAEIHQIVSEVLQLMKDIRTKFKEFDDHLLQAVAEGRFQQSELDKVRQGMKGLHRKVEWLEARGLIGQVVEFDDIDALYRKHKPLFDKARDVVKGEQTAVDEQAAVAFYRQKLTGVSVAPVVETVKTVVPTTSSPASGPLFSQVAKEYCDERMKGGNWRESTLKENQATFELFTEINDDQPISGIRAGAYRNFKNVLMRLPKNHRKLPQTRNLPIAEILDIEGLSTLSNSRINKHLQIIGSFSTWCVRQSYLAQNYGSGLSIKVKEKASDQRQAFNAEDVRRIFGSSVFTDKRKHPYYFWLPLLGLFTGARIEEICQLHITDIYEESGVWVMSISEDDDGDKSLKNSNSVRIVPIHSQLVSLGFIDFVESLKRRKKTRLFEELKKVKGKYSDAASKWFGRYRQQLGYRPGDGKVFHSFRHTFVTELKRKGVDESVTSALVGHGYGTITYNRYGKGYDLDTLQSAVELLEFNSLPLDKFKWTQR